MALGLGTILALLGISAGSSLLSGPMNSVSNGVGNLVSGGTWQQSGGQIAQNEFNAQEAEKARDWQEYMRDTNYQATVADMQKAGLNPAMMYASGGNASATPSSASASGTSITPGESMDVLGSVGVLMNSVNTARELDYRTKRDEMPERTTEELYNKMGDLVRTVVRTSAR